MIKINRTTDYADKIRSYKIMLDDKCLGEMKQGETRNFEVPEGKYVDYFWGIQSCHKQQIK